MEAHEKLLLTVPEAIELTGYGRTFFLKLVLNGTIPSLKLGRTRRIPRAALERWVEKQAEGNQ